MKILLLTTHLNRGGVAFYTVNLAKHLKKRGENVFVSSSGGEIENLLEEAGIPHIKLDIKTKSEFGPKAISSVPRLVRIIRDNGIELIHAQTRVAQVISEIASRITGVPYVTTCHGFFKYKRLSRRIFPCWGRRAVAISRAVENHLTEELSIPPENVRQVYTGIDLSPYRYEDLTRDAELAETLGIDKDVFVVGSVGRLSSVKGYKYLVEAFKEVSNSIEKSRLLLVGSGPEEKALKEQIDKLNLNGKVIITSGEDAAIQKYLSIMDVFCLTSIHEGLGLSLMEAMASGKACIASDIGGLSELIKNEKDGLLVEPENSEKIAKAIVRLAKDEELRTELAGAAKKKSAAFSIEDSAERTLSVYREVV